MAGTDLEYDRQSNVLIHPLDDISTSEANKKLSSASLSKSLYEFNANFHNKKVDIQEFVIILLCEHFSNMDMDMEFIHYKFARLKQTNLRG